MRYVGFIFLLGCNLAFGQTRPQNLPVYSIKNGLSNNTVFCIKKDSRGFLWIGTSEGLNRFDGYKFRHYFAEKNNQAGLPNDYILDILEYQYGRLLIATTNGMSVLNTLTGEFENEKIQPSFLKPGSGTIITSFFKDKSANIWINHSGELDLLDSNLNYQYRFSDLPWATSLKGVAVLLEQWQIDKKGRLWLPSDTTGIHIIDPKVRQVYNRSNNPEQLPFLEKPSIRSMAIDTDNEVLLYAPWGEGLRMYDFKTGIDRQELFGITVRDENSTINSIIKAGPGRFLFYVGSDCYEVKTSNFKFRKVPERSVSARDINESINTITLSGFDNKQFWVGTTAGLVRFDDQKPLYSELAIRNAGAGKVADCSDMIISRSGKIYCTYSNNELVIVQKDRNEFSTHSLLADAKIQMTEVCEDHAGNIWIGTTQGIFRFDTASKKFSRNDIPASLTPRFSCNVIYCDNDGDVWIATRDPFGLYLYHPATKQLEKISNEVTTWIETESPGGRISSIYGDKEGVFWMTSRANGGIVRFIKSRNEWKLFPASAAIFNQLRKKGVECMYVDKEGILYIGNSTGDGLIRFDHRNDSITRFNRNDGLPTNYIRSITGDEAGNIWLASTHAITRFNLKQARPQFNMSYDAFRDADQQALYDPHSRSLVFSANNRLLFLSAAASETNIPAPSAIIDKISINNEWRIVHANESSMKLHHEQNNIAIEFTAPTFSQAEEVHFAYMLSGADKDWRIADNSRTVQYASLAPGEYRFMIKTSFENGPWGNAYSPVTFIISPSWWTTWWFRSLLLAGAAGIAFFFVRKRIQIIRHEAALQQQIAETETRALRAQMNPHFIFNCLSSIDNLIQSGEKEKATTYLAKFARLLRAILENSKSNTIPCWKDLETLKLYLELEELRFERRFSYHLNIAPEILHGDYKVPPMIIQPYVENAIHHGLLNKEGGLAKLSIDVRVEKGQIKFIVEDNGIGRKKAAEYKQLNKPTYQSMGMDITRERVHLFNGIGNGSVNITDLYDEKNEATGTRVEIHLQNQL